MHSQINFGYPWLISYGHLILGLLVGALFAVSWVRKWNKAAVVLLGLVTLWALTAWVMVRFQFDLDGRATMPTAAFLPSGSGKVLDMGAGTGRSTLMVLEARPQATVVALDLFGESYAEHFGKTQASGTLVDEGRLRLVSNLKAAGLDSRATIQPGDMRHMPLEDGSFDGIVSAYAIDHLNREGVKQALAEANRVLKPGGQFLLMVIAKDGFLKFTFGPLVAHAHMVAADYWPLMLREAGFEIQEEGAQPATKYVLARKR